MKCDLQPLNLLKEVKSPGTPSLDGALLDLSFICSSDEKTFFYTKHSTLNLGQQKCPTTEKMRERGDVSTSSSPEGSGVCGPGDPFIDLQVRHASTDAP